MKTFMTVLVGILLLTPAMAEAKTGWLYVHEGELFGSYALVERDDFPYDGELWLVEVGIGCSMWSHDDEWALFDTGYGVFLDGISDKLMFPDSYLGDSCTIWDAFPIYNWEYELYGYEQDQFLDAISNLY